MAKDRAYRVVVSFHPEEERFGAAAPELELEASGESREAAVAALEAAIEAAFERAATDEKTLPDPVDVVTEPGRLELELAAPVWRDLRFFAEAQELAPEALALQLLTRALGQLDGRGGRRPRAAKAKAAEGPPEQVVAEGASEAQEGQENRRRGRGRGRGRGGRREGYRPDMEDQANFLAYVRDQERGGRGRR